MHSLFRVLFQRRKRHIRDYQLQVAVRPQPIMQKKKKHPRSAQIDLRHPIVSVAEQHTRLDFNSIHRNIFLKKRRAVIVTGPKPPKKQCGINSGIPTGDD